MIPSPITSWQIDRVTMETVTDFIFFGSKITADGDCSHDINVLNVEFQVRFFTLLFHFHQDAL